MRTAGRHPPSCSRSGPTSAKSRSPDGSPSRQAPVAGGGPTDGGRGPEVDGSDVGGMSTVSELLGCAEAGLKVGQDVLNTFQPDRESNQAGGDAGREPLLR